MVMQDCFFLLQNPVNCIRATVELDDAEYAEFLFCKNPVRCIQVRMRYNLPEKEH